MVNLDNIYKRIKTLEEEILASTPSDAWDIGEKSANSWSLNNQNYKINPDYNLISKGKYECVKQ